MRTAVPFGSSIRHAREIFERVKSKFFFVHMPQLNAFHEDLRLNTVNVHKKEL